MKRLRAIASMMLIAAVASAQAPKSFTTVKELPITSVKNKEPKPGWRESVQSIIDKYVGPCPESFVYEGKTGPYQGIWYMSRDYMTLNTTYIFLNRNALPKKLRKAINL